MRKTQGDESGATEQARAVELLDGPAAGNAVVVQRLLAQQEVKVPLRTLQHVLAPHRQAPRAAELATVRFETPPGYQLQIDFGEKWVEIAGARTKVHFFVAVLGYSRHLFVRASLSQRQDDWRERLVGAFRAFGGVPRRVLLHASLRASALVRETTLGQGQRLGLPAVSAGSRHSGGTHVRRRKCC